MTHHEADPAATNQLASGIEAYAEELPDRSGRRRLSMLARQLHKGGSIEPIIGRPYAALMESSAMSAAGHPPVHIVPRVLQAIQRHTRRRREALATVFYPLLVLFIVFAVAGVIWGLVIPPLRDMITDFGIETSAVTQLVLSGSFAKLLLGGILVFTVCGLLIIGHKRLDPILRYVPFVGGYRRDVALARFCEAAAVLLQAGRPPSESARVAGEESGSAALHRASQRWADALERDPEAPLDTQYPLQATVAFALKAPATGAARQEILQSLAHLYERRAGKCLDLIRKACEPLFITLVGAMVGFTVVALFAPLISLIQNLT